MKKTTSKKKLKASSEQKPIKRLNDLQIERCKKAITKKSLWNENTLR